jgi:hypothetical protein
MLLTIVLAVLVTLLGLAALTVIVVEMDNDIYEGGE